jgi:hypothetical protein
MKTISKSVAVLLAFTAMSLSCKKAENAEVSNETSMETKDAVSSSAAVEKKDSHRKFVRTADIKFKVKSVAQSTYAIENAVNKFGGFVSYTNLQSTISEHQETKVSQDSTLESTKYKVENNITIRVPNTRLDTVIKTIAKQIAFLDSRVIKADDVSLQMLANQLAQKRSAVGQKRLEKAIDTKGSKLNTIVDAETNLADKGEQSDTKKIENLSLEDQVSFSTVTLQIYQRETLKLEMIGNEKGIDAYRPHLGLQLVDSLKTGWYMLETLIAFIVQLWALILIGSIGFVVYKKYLKKVG